jgi:hypothetical protein
MEKAAQEQNYLLANEYKETLEALNEKNSQDIEKSLQFISIGDIIQLPIKAVKYTFDETQISPTERCSLCCLYHTPYCVVAHCSSPFRDDNKEVYFKIVKE